jgi:hypothetical protein
VERERIVAFLWLFGFGAMALLYFAVYCHLPPNSAVGVTVLTGYTSLCRVEGRCCLWRVVQFRRPIHPGW